VIEQRVSGEQGAPDTHEPVDAFPIGEAFRAADRHVIVFSDDLRLATYGRNGPW